MRDIIVEQEWKLFAAQPGPEGQRYSFRFYRDGDAVRTTIDHIIADPTRIRSNNVKIDYHQNEAEEHCLIYGDFEVSLDNAIEVHIDRGIIWKIGRLHKSLFRF